MTQIDAISNEKLESLSIKAKFAKSFEGQRDNKIILLLEHHHTFDRGGCDPVKGNRVAYAPGSANPIISELEDIDEVIEECRSGDDYTELDGHTVTELVAHRT